MASSRIMNDPAAHDEMQGNHEAFPGCSKNKASNYNTQESRNFSQWFPKPKGERGMPVLHSMQENYSTIWENYAISDQCYNGPFYGQEIFAQPYVHPEFITMQQITENIFENNVYPINHDYTFPIDNRYRVMYHQQGCFLMLPAINFKFKNFSTF
ncbi:hypothetical protein Cni_G25167 [Canna indica]|uniref:Uncharacterized protein n=1 Tax=Canna indica TaxID=4628 RepID=A0AAQ3QQ94_9LILI|nr:hypothetical protein Cni_G25167 [Canna indica]